MNRDLVRQLGDEQFHNLMTALKGPDLMVMEKAKWVLSAFIRRIAEPDIVQADVRRRPLEYADAVALYGEIRDVARLLISANRSLGTSHSDEMGGGLVNWVRGACEHFFRHVFYGLDVLCDHRLLLPPEVDHEVRALRELALVLDGFFRSFDADMALGCAYALHEDVLDWIHCWYPDWELNRDFRI